MGFISGLRNCHLPGLNSYVIRERISDAEGMIRVFHNLGTQNFMDALYYAGDFSLAPHNHRQDIAIFPLVGKPVNVRFNVDHRHPGRNKFEYVFGSALLNGKFSVDSVDTCMMEIEQAVSIPDAGSFMVSAEVHTVIAPPKSAWLILEGKLAPPRQKNLCYSTKPDFRLSPAGLYEPMAKSELRTQSRIWEVACNKLIQLGMDVEVFGL